MHLPSDRNTVLSRSRSSNPHSFLSREEASRVAAAVQQAESQTSAEIKVVLTRFAWLDLRAKAAKLFRKHGLDRTAARNCVMILIVPSNREFLVYGDTGIHAKVGQLFWHEMRDAIASEFRAGRVVEGLEAGVRLAGAKLAEYFPHSADDKDEVSNAIVID